MGPSSFFGFSDRFRCADDAEVSGLVNIKLAPSHRELVHVSIAEEDESEETDPTPEEIGKLFYRLGSGASA